MIRGVFDIVPPPTQEELDVMLPRGISREKYQRNFVDAQPDGIDTHNLYLLFSLRGDEAMVAHYFDLLPAETQRCILQQDLLPLDYEPPADQIVDD